jgi:hypothetical protein
MEKDLEKGVLCMSNIKKLFRALLLVLVILFPKLSNADPLDNWHLRSPLSSVNHLNGVTYASGTFVAVGDGGTLLTSPDGAAWTQRGQELLMSSLE